MTAINSSPSFGARVVVDQTLPTSLKDKIDRVKPKLELLADDSVVFKVNPAIITKLESFTGDVPKFSYHRLQERLDIFAEQANQSAGFLRRFFGAPLSEKFRTEDLRGESVLKGAKEALAKLSKAQYIAKICSR